MKKIIAILIFGVMLLSGCDHTTTSSSESITTEKSIISTESNTITVESEPEDSSAEIKMTDEEFIWFVKEKMDNYTGDEAHTYLINTNLNYTPVDETFLICYAKAIDEALDYIADNSEHYFINSDTIKLSFFDILYYEPHEFVVSYYNENGLPCYDILVYTGSGMWDFETFKGVNYDEQVAFMPIDNSNYPDYFYRTQYTENGDNITEWYTIYSNTFNHWLACRKIVKPSGEIICEYYLKGKQYFCSEKELSDWASEIEERGRENGYTIAPYTSKELTKDDILSDELFDEMTLFIYHELVNEN